MTIPNQTKPDLILSNSNLNTSKTNLIPKANLNSFQTSKPNSKPENIQTKSDYLSKDIDTFKVLNPSFNFGNSDFICESVETDLCWVVVCNRLLWAPRNANKAVISLPSIDCALLC